MCWTYSSSSSCFDFVLLILVSVLIKPGYGEILCISLDLDLLALVELAGFDLLFFDLAILLKYYKF